MAAKPRPCKRCSRINLQRLFAEADEYFTATFPFIPPWCNQSNGQSTRAWENEMAKPTVLLCEDSQQRYSTTTPCSVCSFFKNIGEEPLYYHMKTHDSVSVRRHTPLAHTSSSKYLTFCSSLRLISNVFDVLKHPVTTDPDRSSPTLIDRSFLALTPDDSKSHRLQRRVMSSWSCDGFSLFQAMPENRTHTGLGDGIWGRIVPEWVDMTLAQHWLEFCTRHHLKTCRAQHLNAQLLPFIQLIDCKHDGLAVEEHPSTTEYTALSYVWAASPEVSCGWPNVVLHAAEVTKQLGYQYLWVDRYCIGSGNEDQKQKFIENMHLIYQQAQVTLVAAGSDFDGLPGVHLNHPPGEDDRPRTKQKKVQIGSMNLVSFMHIEDTMKRSNWSYRGWTFQEGLLSKRLLVFTTDQLYWNCCGMSEIESLYIPPALSHLPDLSAQGQWMAPGIFDRISKGSRRSKPMIQGTSPEDTAEKIYGEIWEDIGNYTCRRLTYGLDGLNAFKGAIHMHEARAAGEIKFIWGLPVYTLSGFNLNLKFAYALSTWASAYQRGQIRRENLPSWSWVGWQNEVYWTGKDNSISALSEHTQQFYNYYAPDIRLLDGFGRQDPGFDVRSAFESTSNLDTFEVLRFLRPYIIQKKAHPRSTTKFNVRLSQYDYIDVESIPQRHDYQAILSYSNKHNLQDSRLLILKLTRNMRSGEQLWERVGVAQLHKWNKKMEFEEFVDYIGLVRSTTNFLVA